MNNRGLATSLFITLFIFGQSFASYGSDFPLSAILLLVKDEEPSLPSCANQIPEEGIAQGDYRSYSYPTQYPVTSMAASSRGWRIVAGTEGEGLFSFHRDQANPLVHALTEKSIHDVDISLDGSVITASDSDGKIYLFSCDTSVPHWSYATGGDDNDLYPEVEVVLSDDGRWLVAASDYHLYLFRWDSGAPVWKQQLSQNERLSSLDFSGDGSKIAVATEFGPAKKGLRSSMLHVLDRQGQGWKTEIFSQDAECTANISELPLALDESGSHLAVAGCDDRVRFFDTALKTPLWEVEVGDGEMITSVAISGNGQSLSFIGDTVRYVRDTGSAPDFSSSDSWAFNYWLTYSRPSVYGGLDSWGAPWDGNIGKNPLAGQQNLSMSENGHYMYAGGYGVSYLLHRDDHEVTRLFGVAQDVGQGFWATTMSPDASWVAAGSTFGDEILRFEVAPVQKISAAIPISVTFPDNPANVLDVFDFFGVDSFTIDYQILKPGRAADLVQDWYLNSLDKFGTWWLLDLLCSGDSSWSWVLNLDDGNIESSGSREIEAPQCFASSVSTIESYHLYADLEPENGTAGGVSLLYRDQLPLVKVQVGTGGSDRLHDQVK